MPWQDFVTNLDSELTMTIGHLWTITVINVVYIKKEVWTMSYSIKLKSGFFKTLKYRLSVEEDQLILKPELSEGYDLISIKNDDVLELGLIRYPGGRIEFEIIATGTYYFGCLSPETDLEVLMGILRKSFGRRFSIE